MAIKLIANRYALHFLFPFILLPICKIILTRKLFICNILRWYSLQCHDQDNVIIDDQICVISKLHENFINLFVLWNCQWNQGHITCCQNWFRSIYIGFIVTPASFLYSSIFWCIHICIQKWLACRGKEGLNIEKG